MKSRMRLRVLFLVVLGRAAPMVWAADIDEAVAGDLSNLGRNPSSLELTNGSNLVSGRQGAPDIDFLHVVVPPGHVLDALLVLPGTVVGNGRSFIGVQQGDEFSADPAAAREEDLLGYTHINAVFAPRDLLQDIGAGFGAQGFSGPLPAGDYTFWIMETASGSFPFRFDFVVSMSAGPAARQVPALGTVAQSLLFLALMAMGSRRLTLRTGRRAWRHDPLPPV